MKEKSGKQQKIAASKKKRRLRTMILAGAALVIAAAAAGCARKPSEPTEKPTEEVTPEPTAAPTPTLTSAPPPASALSPKPTVTPPVSGRRVTFTGTTAEVSEAKVGDTVQFGSYEQDNDVSNGAEAIEWLVLDKQGGKLLLLSKDALDCKKYNEENEEREAVTWETCTLRSWLNGEFYNTAFRQTEQEHILTTQVKNEDNPYYGSEGGNDTEDKVFLLSIGEVLDYFDPDPDASDPAHRAKVTEYAKAQGGWAYSEAEYGFYGTTEYDGNGWWWLRSPGYLSSSAAFVSPYGYVDRSGGLVSNDAYVARPALWLNPEDATSSSDTAFIPSVSGRRVTFTGTTAEVSEAKVGDTVQFGSYEQDNDISNGAEAIEWLVLDKQDGKLLLLSKDALDCKKYNEENEEREAVTWETCTLRSWLNGEFYNTAFRQTEQERILTTQVKNEDNPYYGTEGIEGGKDTKDKIFLLSIDEVLNYFDPAPDLCDPARPAKVTEYAKAQGGAAYNEVKDDLYHTTEYNGNGWWWLRSPGRNSYHAAEVGADGRVHRDGLDVNGHLNVVRPVFWLSPES